MNISGYNELDAVLVEAGVPASIHQTPKDGEDLRFFSIELEVEKSSDEPMAFAADVLNTFVASGHLAVNDYMDAHFSFSPVLKLVGATDYALLFEDTNAQPPGSIELR